MDIKKELIIFDMDGTLIDSAPSLTHAVNYTLNKIGKEPISLEEATSYIGNGASILMHRALVRDRDYKKYSLDKEFLEKTLKIFLDYYGKNLNEKTKLYNGVNDGLQKLKESGYKIALATNKPHQFVGTMIKHFGIDSYFDIYLGSDILEHKKPNPQMLNYIISKLEVSKSKTIMVGDSSNDILAAKNAQIDSIAVTYGYHNSDLKELKPTYICNSFKEITEILL